MTKARTFERIHPWITFRADLRAAPWPFWNLLGECRSKCEHIAGVPLRPKTAQRLHRLYLVKGIRATTAIEGNTLTEEEVAAVLSGNLRLPASREYLGTEVENIERACERIFEETRSAQGVQLTRSWIEQLNRMVLDRLDVEEGVVPGEIRKHSVGVLRYRGAPAEDCAYLLERLCDWLKGSEFQELRVTPEDEITGAIIKAVLAHLYIAWIHPFGDGNGRPARLVEFAILISAGVPTPAAHLLSNHYNLTRNEYYRRLDQASQSGGDIIPFLMYAITGLRDGLREQLDVIRTEQHDVAWRNYVHESFRARKSESFRRQRELVLELSRMPNPVPPSELLEANAWIARLYAHKTERTLFRDLQTLEGKSLIRRTKRGVVANRNLILAFLPQSAQPADNSDSP